MKYWEVMKYFIEDRLAIRRTSWIKGKYVKLMPIPSWIKDNSESPIMYVAIHCNPYFHLMENYYQPDVDAYTATDWEYLTKEEEDGLCRRSNCCIQAWKENQETALEANGARLCLTRGDSSGYS